MKLTLTIFVVTVEGTPSLRHYTDARWIDPSAPGEIGLSTLARKALTLAMTPSPQQALF